MSINKNDFKITCHWTPISDDGVNTHQIWMNFTDGSNLLRVMCSAAGLFQSQKSVGGSAVFCSVNAGSLEVGKTYIIEYIISSTGGHQLIVDGVAGTADPDTTDAVVSDYFHWGGYTQSNLNEQISDFRYEDLEIEVSASAITERVEASASLQKIQATTKASVAATTGAVTASATNTVHHHSAIDADVAAAEATATAVAIHVCQVAADVATIEAAAASVLRHIASVGVGAEILADQLQTDDSTSTGSINPDWNWVNSYISISSGKLNHVTSFGPVAFSDAGYTVGKTYHLTYTVESVALNTIWVAGVQLDSSYTDVGIHDVTVTGVASAFQLLQIYFPIQNGSACKVSNVSIHEVYDDYMAPVEASASTKAIHTASVDAEVHGYIETNDDPDIDSPGNWTVDAGSATVDTDGIHFPGGFTYVSWPGEENIVEGESYRVTFEITNYSGTAGVTVALRNLATTFRIGNGVYSEVIVAGSGADNTTHILATNPCTCDIPYLNIEHVTGVQASASLLKGVKVASVAADVAATEANADSTNVHTASVAARLCIRTQNNTDQNIQSPGSWSTTNCTANTGEIVFANPGSNAFAYWPGYLNIKAGRTYRVVYTISDWSAGIIGVRVGGDNTNFNGANGTYEDILYATQDGTTINSGISTFPGTTAKVTFCLVEELEGVTASASSTSIHKARVGIGAEENPDVTPSTPSEWDLETYDTGDWWDLTNNKLVCSPALGNSGSGVTSQNVDLTLGRTYLLRYQCTITAGSLITYLHGTSNPGIERTSSGSYSELIVIDDATDLGAGADIVFAANALSSDLEVWDISVREVYEDYLAPVQASASLLKGVKVASVAADVPAVTASASSTSIHKASVGVSAELCDTTCQPANWSTGANAIPNSDGTISVLSGGGYRTATSTDPLVIGKQYLVTMTVTASANGAGALQGLSAWGTIYTSAGTYTQVLTATTTDRFGVGFSGDAGTISGISIKEVQDDYLAPVEASASSTWTSGSNTYQAAVDADVPAVEASAAAKAVHTASVAAEVPAVICSNESRFNAYATVAAVAPAIEASAAAKVIHKASVAGEVAEYVQNNTDPNLTSEVGWSLSSDTTISGGVIHFNDVGTEIITYAGWPGADKVQAGHTYYYEYEVTNYVDGSNIIAIGNDGFAFHNNPDANGVYSGYITAEADGDPNANCRLYAGGAGSGTYDVEYLIVEEVRGVSASASTKTIHTAAVAAETGSATASAVTRGKAVASVDAGVASITAAATTKTTHIASVGAEVPSIEASSTGQVIHIASVAADVPAVESTSHLAKGEKLAQVAAVTAPVESSATAKAVHIAAVAADTPSVTASAVAHYVRTAAIDADVPSVTASTVAKVIHIASVAAEVPAVICSNESRFNAYATVAAVTPTVEASATAKVIHKASVDADVTGRSQELLTDTTFNATYWGAFGSVSFNGDGTADITSGGGLAQATNDLTEAGKTYEFTFTVSGLDTGDYANPYFGFSAGPSVTVDGTYVIQLYSVSADQKFGFGASLTTSPSITISGVSVKQVTGVQASANTKTTHTAAVAAETGSVTASAVTRGKAVASVAADAPTTVAAAVGKAVHIAKTAYTSIWDDPTLDVESNYNTGPRWTYSLGEWNYVNGAGAPAIVTYATYKYPLAPYGSQGAKYRVTVTIENVTSTGSGNQIQVWYDWQKTNLLPHADGTYVVEGVANNTGWDGIEDIFGMGAKKGIASNELSFDVTYFHVEIASAFTPLPVASASANVTHTASVDADVPATEASANLARGQLLTRIEADAPAVTTSAAAKVTHIASVAANTPSVEASATNHYVRTASVAAAISAITATASSKVTHTAAVDAAIPAISAIASTKAVHIASVAADTPAVTASASAKGVESTTVAADVPATEASATAKVIHIASVDADTGGVIASASNVFVRKASIAADVPPVEASASAGVTHKAAVAADVPAVEASASTRQLITAAVDAETGAVFAGNAGAVQHFAYIVANTTPAVSQSSAKAIHKASVDAVVSVEASASAGVTRKVSIDAVITPVEASAFLTKGEKLARVEADVPAITASATAKVIHKASIDTVIGSIESSVSAKTVHIAAVLAEAGSITASGAAIKDTKKAAIDADTGAVTASATVNLYRQASVDATTGSVTASLTAGVTHKASVAAVVTVGASATARAGASAASVDAVVQVGSSATARVIHTASVAADITSVTAAIRSGIVLINAQVDASIGQVETTAVARVTHTAAVDAVLTPVDADINIYVEGVFDPNAVTACTTWTFAARHTTWTMGARPTTWTVAKRSTNWIIKCRNTVYRLFCK